LLPRLVGGLNVCDAIELEIVLVEEPVVLDASQRVRGLIVYSPRHELLTEQRLEGSAQVRVLLQVKGATTLNCQRLVLGFNVRRSSFM
jgi:hypothetical protein